MIKREFGLFLLVGSVTVFIDYIAYRTLIWIHLLDVDEAKSVGFITGTVFAFFANRYWTFSHKRHAAGIVWRFALLYAFSLSTNVIINSLALSVFIAQPVSVQLAFIIATGVSAAINFVGMKSFVFKAATPRDLT